MTQRGLRPDDLFNLTLIGDVALSPDGATVCFVQTRLDRASNAYYSDLWLVAATGEPGGARQITWGPRTVAQPRWSPDGRWLAFLADRDHKGRRQLWLLPTDGHGGEAHPLTAGESGVSDFAWAPDSSRLVFVRSEHYAAGNAGTLAADDPYSDDEGKVTDDVVTVTTVRYKGDGVGYTNARRSHLWLVDLAGAETRLTEGAESNSMPAWSPDNQHLVFVSKRGEPDERDFSSRTDLWLLDVATPLAEPQPLPTGEGMVSDPAWSPDGQWIAFAGTITEGPSGANSGLWIIPASGASAPRDLTADTDLSVGFSVSSDVRAGFSACKPTWTADSQAVLMLASVRGDTPLWRFPLGGAPTKLFAAEQQQVQDFSCDAATNTVALNLADNLNPGDLYIAQVADPAGTLRRLTTVNEAFLQEIALSAPEAFTYTGPDDWEIEGWLMQPVNVQEGQQYPLILAIHGGPHAAYGNSFFFDFQLLAARGWGVLFTNPRGSTNYGEAFTRASNDDWGGKDYQDLLCGVEAAIARAPWIDPDRLGVTGGSYGGYMTNWIVTQTDRFKAAVTERSICNMVSKWGTSDIGFIGNDRQWGGPPWENMAFYQERSPLTHVQNVTTPLLLIHSERDFRCLVEQGEQFYTALKYLRRPAEFVRFPNEGHELSRSGQPLHRLERLRRIVGWFDRYL